MSQENVFKGISKRARLLLKRGEDKNVDYKEKSKGLQAEDIVAFANSITGGAILIGVQEVEGKNRKQKGEIIGHPIDDGSKLQIINKALSCSPPIQIEIYVENLGANPFFRVEIPSGSQKPYSTNSGTYKVRVDGRNNPLLPEQLLEMFLEHEGEEFRGRFSQATGDLENSMTEALSLVSDLESIISGKIEEIGSSLGWADFKAGESVDAIDALKSQVFFLEKEEKKIGERVKAIISKLEAEDPIKKKFEEEVFENIIQKLIDDPSILEAAKNGKELSASLSGEAAEELDQEDLQRLFTKAFQHVRSNKKENKENGS